MTGEGKRDQISEAVRLVKLSQACLRIARQHLQMAGIETRASLYSSDIALWQAEILAPIAEDLP